MTAADYTPTVEDMREWVREHAYTDGDIVSAIGMLEIVLANERAKALEDAADSLGVPLDSIAPITMGAIVTGLRARAARIRGEVGKR